MYIKIDKEGNIASIANTKYISYDDIVVVNPKDEHFKAAGYLPVLNPNDMPETPEGYTYNVKYRINKKHTGYNKCFEYIELPKPEPIEENIDTPNDEFLEEEV